MEVHYKWSFLVGDQPLTEIRAPAKPATYMEEIKEEEEAGGDGDAKIEVLVSQPTEEQINVDEKSEVESTKVISVQLFLLRPYSPSSQKNK